LLDFEGFGPKGQTRKVTGLDRPRGLAVTVTGLEAGHGDGYR